MHLLNIIIKKMQNMQLKNQIIKNYLDNNKELLQKKQKEVKEKEKEKRKKKEEEIEIEKGIEKEIIEEVEVGVEVGIGIEIIIIEEEVMDQKKLINVLIVGKKGIGLMNVIILEKNGKYIYFFI